MTDERPETKPCYREATNGVYFIREQHGLNCEDSTCRGCKPCVGADHCTARRNCTWHLSAGELTCGRCLAAVRRDLRWIASLAALLPTAALGDGVNSEAANLSGPSVDPEAWSWRKAAARSGKGWHLSLIEEDDEHHPERVLGTWERMLREDYDQPTDAPLSVADAAAYLDRNLHRVAHDDGQDFTLLGRELKKCRQHLESVLHNDTNPERGIPCPTCTSDEAGLGPRLVRHYPHWCNDEDCQRLHRADDADDVWQCPREAKHVWSHEDYDRRLVERKASA